MSSNVTTIASVFKSLKRSLGMHLGVILCCACGTLPASPVLFYVNVGGATSLRGFPANTYLPGIGFETLSAVDATPQSGIERTESFAVTGDLSAGVQRLSTSGNINGGTADFTSASVNTFVSFGDTITYTGSSFGGSNLTARVNITGAWNTFALSGSTVSNYSYLRVLFLRPGSFDTPNFFASPNILYQSFFGLGPNDTQLPFGVPYTSFISSFPGTIDLPVPLSGLPQGTQVVFLTQNYLTGDMTPGGNGVGWMADLGSTLHVQLIAPPGVTLTTAGGLPKSTASATPEPSTMFLAIPAAVLGGIHRRRSRTRERSRHA